jgi:hypothetical protein
LAENCEDVADNSQIFDYLAKQYDKPSVENYQESFNVVAQSLGRALSLQEKIELKKLALLKQKGRRLEYKALLDQSSFIRTPKGS